MRYEHRRLIGWAIICICASVVAYRLFTSELNDGLDGFITSLFFEHDTEYAKGFSESNFKSVKVGMTQQEVITLLGPPLEKWSPTSEPENYDFGMRWTRSPGDKSYSVRVLHFRQGHVSRKIAEFYVD